MVDLLMLVVLSWCVWFGWQRGFIRTCLDAVALIVPMFLVTLSIPFLKGVLVDRGWDTALEKWMAAHLVKTSPESSGFLYLTKATPVGEGFGVNSSLVVERFYDLVLLGLMGGAVFIGLKMILKVYETLWLEARGVWKSRGMGMMMGLGIGLTINTYLVSVFGLICWLQGLAWIDSSLMDSLFVRGLYRAIFW
ncbi:MAG TPA: hypothetical protein VFV52_03315 [Bacilli bacterium]|nr:hypothetical protein [Bacilli bacterium]